MLETWVVSNSLGVVTVVPRVGRDQRQGNLSRKIVKILKENRRNMLFTKSSRWNIVLIQPVVVVN